MFSSNDVTWETPWELFLKLHGEFNFNLDVCALPQTAKCVNYFTPDIDGLSQDWIGTCWMNPPYGREISIWLKKAYEESLKGSTVVCLIPARTDTKYWHEYCMKAAEIRFIKGRIKFGNSRNSAPFPSAIVIFKNNNNLSVRAYDPSIIHAMVIYNPATIHNKINNGSKPMVRFY
jgi:phage N-6-adenine-methyltransferase